MFSLRSFLRVALLPVVAGACASSTVGSGAGSAPTSIATTSPQRVGTAVGAGPGGAEMDIRPSDNETEMTVGYTSAQLLKAIPVVYQRFGFRLTANDPARRVVTARRANSRRPILGKELTALMDCGDSNGTPNVARYDVTIDLTALVVPKTDSAAVKFRIDGRARPTTSMGDGVTCQATMAFHRLFQQELRTAAAVQSSP